MNPFRFLAVAALSLLATAAWADVFQINPTGYSTGYLCPGAPAYSTGYLCPGAPDPNYTFVDTRTGQAYTPIVNRFIYEPWGWWDVYNSLTLPGDAPWDIYKVSTTFVLTASEAANAELDLTWFAAGESCGYPACGPTLNGVTQSYYEGYQFKGGFQAGVNTITWEFWFDGGPYSEFAVWNDAPPTNPLPPGSAVPEPRSLELLAMFLLGSVGLLRRKRA